MSDRVNTEEKLLSVYQKVNPSTYAIEAGQSEFRNREVFFSGLLHHRLCFPKRMFSGSDLIEFGSGTGEHSLFYLLWGAQATFVEINGHAIQRMNGLFDHFKVPTSSYSAIQQSIFDFEPDRTWDIVATMGVLHHLEDKEQAFDRVASCVAPEGFLLLGVGNKAGMFQRNLQRLVVHHFAGQDHERIEQVAEKLFSEHLDRAQRFGRRSRKAIIYDTYVNPKIDSMSVGEVMTLFRKNGLRLFSAWPPVTPAMLGDSPARPVPEPLEWPSLLGMAELAWLAHREDDADVLPAMSSPLNAALGSLDVLLGQINDQTADAPLAMDELLDTVKQANAQVGRMPDPYRPMIDRVAVLLTEVDNLVKLLAGGSIDDVHAHLQGCETLFRGTGGLGMNYFVGQKLA